MQPKIMKDLAKKRILTFKDRPMFGGHESFTSVDHKLFVFPVSLITILGPSIKIALPMRFEPRIVNFQSYWTRKLTHKKWKITF